MGRLTKRVGSAIVTKATIKELGKKLAELEDMEEQGRLVKLPCKVGDTVYIIGVDEDNFEAFYCPLKVHEVKFNLELLPFIDITVFLSREEAEEKLKEVQNG